MKRFFLVLGLAVAFIVAFNPAAQAQPADEAVDHAAETVEAAHEGMVIFPNFGLKTIGIGLGMGLALIGGGRAIGNIGAAAVESMARQPEASKDISGAMILSAAMVEGATLFAVVVAFLMVFVGN